MTDRFLLVFLVLVTAVVLTIAACNLMQGPLPPRSDTEDIW